MKKIHRSHWHNEVLMFFNSVIAVLYFYDMPKFKHKKVRNSTFAACIIFPSLQFTQNMSFAIIAFDRAFTRQITHAEVVFNYI